MKFFLKPLAATALLVVWLTANAQTEIADNLYVEDARVPAKFSTNVFIVRMKDAPVVGYEGGIGRYKATKPQKGKKINPNSGPVRAYVNYLDGSHDDALASVGANEKIYDYRYGMNGFAAVLTTGQADQLSARDDVLSVDRDVLMRPQTDSTPAYLGLTGPDGVWTGMGKGEDVIIGVLDTGITPEHPSFSDQSDLSDPSGNSGKRGLAYGPPPSDWYGTCQSGEAWSQDDCNNKLIGARYFHAGFGAGNSGLPAFESLSARDINGHGSHTAGTAGGNEGVPNSISSELMSGVAPRARIAAYKVCWESRLGPDDGGCASSDSAAATDAAIADGVDVINFSIGGGSNSFSGPDDIGFLFAADAGVWVATSNGNAGPGAQTVGTPSGVPWITAVGATQDNEVFGLGLIVSGDLDDTYDAIEGAGDVPFSADVSGAMVPADPHNGCTPLSNTDMAGEIALVIRGACAFTDKYNNAAAAGAAAIIVYNDGASATRVDPITMAAPGTTIPGAMIGHFDGADINATVSGGGSVDGLIGPGTQSSQDNRIAGFSSRGPNGGAPDVIKPDVSAPGVRIIAADASVSQHSATREIRISGTSMASPHIAGVFALLKEQHPDWSAAMAKSAVMTSARQNLRKTTGDTMADPFDIGAGHVVPAAAFNPGLVYDAGFLDYLAFSCDNNVQLVSDGTCAWLVGNGFPTDGSDLNLASIGVANLVGSQTVTRHVTSVTDGSTTFTASVDAPSGVDVEVSPAVMTLDMRETATFTVTLSANSEAVAGEWTFGSLTWDNDQGASAARSPIAVNPAKLDAPAEVTGSGTDGSTSFDIGFGYAGDYAAGTHGLVEATLEAGNVLDDPGNSFAFFGPGTTLHLAVLSADTQAARWSLFDENTDGNDDLDLYVYHCTDFCRLRGSSGNFDSNEEVTLTNPASGLYAIFVHGWQTDGEDANYDLFSWAPGVDAGNMTVTGPASATLGAVETIDVSWSGLDAGKKYLGAVSHGDAGGAFAQTLISISTE